MPRGRAQRHGEPRGGVLTGNVLVESHVSGSPCGTSNRLTVERLLGDGNAEPLAETTVSGQDGPFEIEVDISEGARLRVTAEAYFDTGIAHCLTATSVFVAGDRDGDGVLNSVDACDDVDGPPAAGPRSGCPELVRVVTSSSYAAGVVTGVVRFTDALVPRTACAGEAQSRVEVWRQLSDDEFDVVLVKGGHYTPEDGRFAIELDEELPVGAVYRIYVRDGVDPLAGYCGSVFSEAFTVDVDSDGDGVDDSVDACDDVDGPAASGPRFGVSGAGPGGHVVVVRRRGGLGRGAASPTRWCRGRRVRGRPRRGSRCGGSSAMTSSTWSS